MAYWCTGSALTDTLIISILPLHCAVNTWLHIGYIVISVSLSFISLDVANFSLQ